MGQLNEHKHEHVKDGVYFTACRFYSISVFIAYETADEPEIWYRKIERFDKSMMTVEYIIKTNESGEVRAVLKIGSTMFELKNFANGSKQDGSGKFITFRFNPGEEVECLLETSGDSQADLYVGSCPPGVSIDTAGARYMTMQRAAVETETEEAVPASVSE